LLVVALTPHIAQRFNFKQQLQPPVLFGFTIKEKRLEHANM
jgi:hypothetical protein